MSSGSQAIAGASALQAQALRAFREGRLTDAIHLFTQVIDGYGMIPPRARAILAAMHCAKEDWVSARDVLAPALADLDPQAMTLYLLASRAIGEARPALDDLGTSGNTTWVDDVAAVVEYGRTCAAAGLTAEAESVLTEVLERTPDHAWARRALAEAYVDSARSADAVNQWRTMVDIDPSNPDYQMDLATGLLKVGRVDEAQLVRDRAEQLGVTGESLCQALYLRLFDDRSTGASVRAAHERSTTGPIRERTHAPRRRDGRLRVGLLSSEFNAPPTTFLVNPILDAIDRGRCQLVRYNSRVTARLHAVGARADDLWRNLPPGEDDALRMIDEDRIDVLVDLAGCFVGNRRDLLMRGAAPVQAAYPLYPGTTGIGAVQWFLTDPWLTPVGTEAEYSERVYRLPGGALCYKPPVALPVLDRDQPGRPLTFGLFQRAIKYSRTTWDLVAGTLRATPLSRLLVHSSDVALDVEGSPLRTRIRSELAARDVDPSRLSFIGGRELPAHLAIVGTVDVALDTYPFSGHATAMESLWMGVPIVTRRGPLHASRVSAGLMAQVGLEECVGDDEAGYVRAATTVTEDLGRLRTIQRGLRQRMVDAGLTDGTRQAREIEDALQTWVGEVR
jgi:predicted O-linked N-acetylglucosamine transferase (SPINDLY family)